MDLTSVPAAVVRGEPGAFETFINEAQGRSSDEMSAAALVLSSASDVQVNELLGNLLFYIGTCDALEPLVLRVVEAFERGEGDAWERALLLSMQDEDIRAGLPHRERLLAAVPVDSWLYGLLMVVGLEPLLVVEAASVRPDLEPEGGIRGQFQLSDASGATSWNEGRRPTSRCSRAAVSSCWTRRRTCGRGTRPASTR